jgi:hypothetical protein
VLAAPVSVVDQTRRLLRDIRRSSHGHELLPRIVPDAVLAVLAGVAGETVGYGAGEGRSAEVVTGFTFHRAANVRAEERGLVTAAPDKPLRQPDGTNAPRA